VKNKVLFILVFVLLFYAFVPRPAKVKAAQPPHMTIVVINPPSDLELSVRYTRDSVTETKLLTRRDIAWEAEFSFLTLDFLDEKELCGNFILIVESKDYNFEVHLPGDSPDKPYPYYTLNLKSQTLFEGYPAWHAPVTISIRIILTLLLEAIIFFLFGYREKRSWNIFAIVNFITNGVLHTCIGFLSDESSAFIFLGIIGVTVIIAEMIAFAAALEEKSRWKAAIYAFVANLLSLVLGSHLLNNLPF